MTSSLYQKALELVLAWLSELLPEPGDYIEFPFPPNYIARNGGKTYSDIVLRIEYRRPKPIADVFIVSEDLAGITEYMR